MTDVPMKVRPNEGGVLRLFAVDTDSEDGAALRDALAGEDTDAAGRQAAAALGVEEVDPWWVTLLRRSELAELGLEGYLAQGHDVPQDQLRAARPALDAAGETLMLVQSPAFGGRAETLTPADHLTPVAAFETLRTPPPAQSMPKAESGGSGRSAPTPPAPPARGGLRPGLILAIVIAAAAILALLAVAGG